MNRTPTLTRFGLLLALSASTAPLAAQTCEPPPSGIVAWWDADSVSATSALELVLENSGGLVGAVATAPGRVGDAFSLDGSSFLDVGAPETLDPGGTSALTVQAWVLLTTAAQDSWAMIVDKRNDNFSTGEGQWALQLQSNATRPLAPEFVVSTTNGTRFAQSSSALSVGAWHHLVGVYDGAAVSLYVDGALAAQVSHTGPIRSFAPGTSPALTIGAFDRRYAGAPGSPKSYFTGLVDEIAVFRRDLGPGEVLALWAAGSAGMCKSFDSDGDGLFDATEAALAEGSPCPSPVSADSDGDGLTDGAEVALGTDPCSADTDADGIADGTDPLPTVPGVTSSYIEEELRLAVLCVQDLDEALIDARNPNARSGRRNALGNKLTAAANALAADDLEEALDQLASVLAKLDGDPSPKDWVLDSAEKTLLHDSLDLLAELVALL